MKIINPSTDEVIRDIPAATEADVEKTIAAARDAEPIHAVLQVDHSTIMGGSVVSDSRAGVIIQRKCLFIISHLPLRRKMLKEEGSNFPLSKGD